MILDPVADAQTRCSTIVDALISILLTGDRRLTKKSMSGLRSLSPLAIKCMTAAIEDNSLSPQDVVVLQDAIDRLRRSTHVRKLSENFLDALLGGLRIGDEELQQLAIRAIACCGPESVDYLIQMAVANADDPDYCFRLFSAAEQGGHQPSGDMRLELLLGFTGTKHTEIRDRALQLFYSFAPHAQASLSNESEPAAMRTVPASASDDDCGGTNVSVTLGVSHMTNQPQQRRNDQF